MIEPDKRRAIFLLHEEGMPLREISRRLRVSRNTVRAVIKQEGKMPDGVRKDKIHIDQELLERLYQECDGWIQRVHEKPTSSWAAALWLYEGGTPDLGTAAAGRAAAAAAASTVVGNPAGMTRLDRSQMLAAVQGIYINSRFDTELSGFGGGDGGNAGGFVPSGICITFIESRTISGWGLGQAPILAWVLTTVTTGPAAITPPKPIC